MCDIRARAARERRNNLAWLLATNPDPTVRDGTQAVKLASWAAELTHQLDPGALDTLAAAYAEAGNFKEAIAAAEQGLRLTDASRDKGLVDQLQTHLTFYRAGRPWRE
jgi:tetratricopeptide (TPR) repeat protein